MPIPLRATLESFVAKAIKPRPSDYPDLDAMQEENGL